MPQTITARRLFTAIGSIEYPVITLSPDGLIEDISSDPSIKSEDTLTAAFLDIHIHGSANHDVMEGTPQAFTAINKFLANKGVAHYLATTVTAPIETTLTALDRIASAIEREPLDGAVPIGIHLEGPFISHEKRGVHPPAEIQPPSIPLFEKFWQASRGKIRLITLAPETPNALELIKHAISLGVKVSLGHSNATAAQTIAAIAAGATSATHTFNAMRPLDHREPGILGTVLDNPALFAELICDGIHVSPELVRLWLRAKSPARAILVTDAISATGMPNGTYNLGNFKVEVADGRATHNGALAGSVLTLDRAVANLQSFTGTSLDAATRCASHTPAQMLGLDSLTQISPNHPANLNLFNAQGRLTKTYLRGRAIN